MAFMLRRLLRGTGFSAVVLSAIVVLSNEAFASDSCNGSGWLCLYDFSNGDYANFSGPNPSWAPWKWNDRADWVRNDGVSMNACVYQNDGYAGYRVLVPRGVSGFFSPGNFGRSNRWTTSTSSCP
jgi:hypothetical protein